MAVVRQCFRCSSLRTRTVASCFTKPCSLQHRLDLVACFYRNRTKEDGGSRPAPSERTRYATNVRTPNEFEDIQLVHATRSAASSPRHVTGSMAGRRRHQISPPCHQRRKAPRARSHHRFKGMKAKEAKGRGMSSKRDGNGRDGDADSSQNRGLAEGIYIVRQHPESSQVERSSCSGRHPAAPVQSVRRLKQKKSCSAVLGGTLVATFPPPVRWVVHNGGRKVRCSAVCVLWEGWEGEARADEQKEFLFSLGRDGVRGFVSHDLDDGRASGGVDGGIWKEIEARRWDWGKGKGKLGTLERDGGV
nr:hypothetical protein CFP56_13148 [Quercus suber]